MGYSLGGGAQATIVGNVVNAKAGTDARTGIHEEALAPYEATRAPHSHSLVTISGNLVYGQFRRGIVSEGVTSAAITSSTIADATWWGIAVTQGGDDVTVVGNSILWTRTAGDLQGSAWSPGRGAIRVYGTANRTLVANNTIGYAAGSAGLMYIAVGVRQAPLLPMHSLAETSVHRKTLPGQRTALSLAPQLQLVPGS
jgi:hypothetical protein